MSIKRLIIICICTITLSSCGSMAQEITKITIHVSPGDGYAYCEFTADGWAEGGHASGDPAFVHMEREQIPQKQVNAIWEAASALDTDKYGLDTSAISDCVECVELLIYYQDGQVMHLTWPFGGQHPDPKVQILAELISENNVGGW